MIELRPFQKRFLRGALAPGIDTAALSLPRGNGKSSLAGHIVTRLLDPADDLFRPGTESVLCAASIEQARIVFRFARADLEDRGGYRFLDSATRVAITHKATSTRLRVIGSNGKSAMGLVNTPWAICDEPGAWETNGGQLLNDAIETAKGKPGSPLKALYIGTLAPARDGWWHDLVASGSHGSAHVTALQGDPERWDRWPEIRRVNPLSAISSSFRRKLLQERNEARRDLEVEGPVSLLPPQHPVRRRDEHVTDRRRLGSGGGAGGAGQGGLAHRWSRFGVQQGLVGGCCCLAQRPVRGPGHGARHPRR